MRRPAGLDARSRRARRSSKTSCVSPPIRPRPAEQLEQLVLVHTFVALAAASATICWARMSSGSSGGLQRV